MAGDACRQRDAAVGDNRRVDALSGLDGVPWADLHGTHGTAEEVPGHLRSPTGDALPALASAVVHQGTRWQVSAHTVTPLVQLIDDPATPDRAAITDLLWHIAIGRRDLPFDAEAAFAAADAVTPDQELLVVERVCSGEEFADDWVEVADACAVLWEARAYRAAAAHVDAYRRWLADGDAEVASRAAELLVWFPPAEETVAALLSADGSDSVRASANLALAYLDAPAPALLDHDVYLVRLTAAIAQAHRLGAELPGAALDILVDAGERETLPDFPPGWRRRASRGHVALALQRLGLGLYA